MDSPGPPTLMTTGRKEGKIWPLSYRDPYPIPEERERGEREREREREEGGCKFLVQFGRQRDESRRRTL